jgi:hypothetical protein
MKPAFGLKAVPKMAAPTSIRHNDFLLIVPRAVFHRAFYTHWSTRICSLDGLGGDQAYERSPGNTLRAFGRRCVDRHGTVWLSLTYH